MSAATIIKLCRQLQRKSYNLVSGLNKLSDILSKKPGDCDKSE